MLGTLVGTTIEWYDFFIYANAAALVLGPLYFSAIPPENQLIVSFATIGVSFLFRSLGAIVAGHLADRVGRKAMLVATLLLMGAATTLIGVLPTAAAIGIWAPILLVFLRCVQGFSAGYQIGFIALLVWVIPFLLLIDRASVFFIFVALLVLTLELDSRTAARHSFRGDVPGSDPELGWWYRLCAWAILGGAFAPTIAQALLRTTGTSLSIAAYLIIVALIAFGATFLAKDRTGARLDEAATDVPGAEDVRRRWARIGRKRMASRSTGRARRTYAPAFRCAVRREDAR